MLNDYLLSKDVVGFVAHYLDINHIELPEFRSRLESLQQKQQLSYAEWWALLEDLNSRLDHPALGLDIGKSVTAEQCGVLGYLLKTSQNLANALHCYSRFERLLYAGGHVEVLAKDSQTMMLSWNPEQGYSSLLSDMLLLSGLLNVARGILAPKSINPIEVSFTHAVSETSLIQCETYFNCPVKTSEARLSIIFKLEDLLYPIPHQDSTLHSLLGKQAQELLGQLPESDLFLSSLHDTIIKCLHEGSPDAETVARHLNMSSRTLHRRLRSKQRIYRDVLKDLRKSMAERYLKDKKLSLTETALLLGYQDQSAFTRAFSSWFGCSPKQYKKKQISTD